MGKNKKYPKINLSDKEYFRMLDKHRNKCKIKGEVKIISNETTEIPEKYLKMRPKKLDNFVDLNEINNIGRSSNKIAGLVGKRSKSDEFNGKAIRIFKVVSGLKSQFSDSDGEKYIAFQFAYIDKDTREIIDGDLYTATSRSKVLYTAFSSQDVQFPFDVILTLRPCGAGKTKYFITSL